MGYSIQYSKDLNKSLKGYKLFRANKTTVWILAGVVMSLLVLLSSRVRSAVWGFCVPGEAEVTMSAFSDMVYDIREGQSVSQAFSDFCKEILSNG